MDFKKAELRKTFCELRTLKRPVSNWNHLLLIDEIASAKVIASYRSYGDEPDTKDLNDQLIAMGKILLFPRTKNEIEWVAWNGDVANLEPNGKLEEPKGPIFAGNIEVMIIPALAIDKEGFRLGQGGGFYDRTLAKTKCWSIALINENELLEENLPNELHDQKVNAAATATRIVRF